MRANTRADRQPSSCFTVPVETLPPSIQPVSASSIVALVSLGSAVILRGLGFMSPE